jgi:predicted enzyme related to lactoylglutathione lyase
MLTQFSHFTIKASNVNTTVQWYCDKLGFVKNHIADEVFASLTHPNLGGLGVYASNTKTPVDRGAGIFFRCDDIQKTVEDLRLKGVTVDDPFQLGPNQSWVSFFYDVDGNKLGIIQ